MKEKLNNKEFRLMHSMMKVIDAVHPHVPFKAASFGVQRGMTVVDYGCGPGRYTVEFAQLVGPEGKVYAVDLLEIALKETEKKVTEKQLGNVSLKLAREYDSGVEHQIADIVFAIDMFHHIQDTDAFLKEVYRIAKPEGRLILSGGHQSRTTTKKAIAQSGLWSICSESGSCLVYEKQPVYIY